MFTPVTTPDSLNYLGSGMNVGVVGGGSGLGGGLGTAMGLGGGNVGGVGMNSMGVGVGAGVSGNHGKMPPQNIHLQAAMTMPNKPGVLS